MEVNGPGPVQSAFPIKQVQPTTDIEKTAQPGPVTPRDEVEISPAGKMLDELSQSSEVRAERLAQIKASIEAGTYETPEKLGADDLPVHVYIGPDGAMPDPVSAKQVTDYIDPLAPVINPNPDAGNPTNANLDLTKAPPFAESPNPGPSAPRPGLS